MPRGAPVGDRREKKTALAISPGAVAAGVSNRRQGVFPVLSLTFDPRIHTPNNLKSTFMKKSTGRFARIAALACIVAGLVGIVGCGGAEVEEEDRVCRHR